MHLRITQGLRDIMAMAGERFGLSMSQIVCKALRSLCKAEDTVAMLDYRKRSGVSFGNEPHVPAHEITRAGEIELQVRCELPKGITSDAIRQKIYDKCLYALSRPEVAEFKTSLREGIDYVVRSEE